MVEFRRRMQAVPWPIRLGLVGTAWALGLLLALFWWWTYTGPYRWLTELQLRLFDAYFPFYTWAVVFVLTGVAGSLVAFLLLLPLALTRRPVAEADDRAAAARVDAWMRAHRLRMFGLLVGVVGAVGGAFLLAVGLTAGKLTAVSAAALEAGQDPGSRWLQVQGRPRAEDDLVMEDPGGGPMEQDHYLPLVSEQWRQGQPVAVYLKASGPRFVEVKGRLRGGTYEGLAWPSGLPGPVRVEFEKRGLTPARNYLLLDYGNRPGNMVDIGALFLCLGLGVLGVTAVAWGVMAYRGRVKAEAASAS
jgi:hypothetical protein